MIATRHREPVQDDPACTLSPARQRVQGCPERLATAVVSGLLTLDRLRAGALVFANEMQDTDHARNLSTTTRVQGGLIIGPGGLNMFTLSFRSRSRPFKTV